MNRRLVIVVAVAVAAFAAAYALLSSGPSARPVHAVVEAQPRVDLDQVLVAAQDLPMGSVVGEAALVWQTWPKAAVSDLMIARSDDANAIREMKGSPSCAASRCDATN